MHLKKANHKGAEKAYLSIAICALTSGPSSRRAVMESISITIIPHFSAVVMSSAGGMIQFKRRLK